MRNTVVTIDSDVMIVRERIELMVQVTNTADKSNTSSTVKEIISE